MVNKMNFNSIEDKKAHLDSLNSIPSINPKKYDANADYQRFDFIEHSEFGNGFVLEIVDKTQLKAFFQSGVKLLKQRNFLN